MSKAKNNELERDDEVLRNRGMVSGTLKAGRWSLRPTTATEVSWMQRNHVLEDSGMDILWKTCAFTYLHHADKPEIRACVNDREEFIEAVDRWMDSNNPKSDDIKTLAAAMNSRVAEWFSSSSELTESGPASGN